MIITFYCTGSTVIIYSEYNNRQPNNYSSGQMILQTWSTDLDVIPDHLTGIGDVLLERTCVSKHLVSQSFLHAVMVLQKTVNVRVICTAASL